MSGSQKLTLPRHTRIHEQLKPYAPLMHWMKSLDQRTFKKLKESYTNSISKLYERNIKIFFDDAKQCISGGKKRKLDNNNQKNGRIFNNLCFAVRGSGSSQDISGMAGKFSSLSARNTSGPVGALLGVDRDQWGIEVSS